MMLLIYTTTSPYTDVKGAFSTLHCTDTLYTVQCTVYIVRMTLHCTEYNVESYILLKYYMCTYKYIYNNTLVYKNILPVRIPIK